MDPRIVNNKNDNRQRAITANTTLSTESLVDYLTTLDTLTQSKYRYKTMSNNYSTEAHCIRILRMLWTSMERFQANRFRQDPLINRQTFPLPSCPNSEPSTGVTWAVNQHFNFAGRNPTMR